MSLYPSAEMALPYHEACKIETYNFLLNSIPSWLSGITLIIDGTSKRIACHEDAAGSSLQTTPGLSAHEDTTLDFSSLEPSSYLHQSCLPTPQQHAASQQLAHKRKRSTSPSPSERSSKINKYRAANAIRVLYDGDAQHELERIVKEAEKGCYDMKKRLQEARTYGLDPTEIETRESIVNAMKTSIDKCYAASLQLLRDGTCESFLLPAQQGFQFALSRVEQVIRAAPSPSPDPEPAPSHTAPLPTQPSKPSAALHIGAGAEINDDNDDDADEDDEFVMSQIAHRLTSRMAKA